MKIDIFKAGPIAPDKPVPDLVISATVSCESDVRKPLDEYRRFYDEQGRLVADALFTHLPGGTCDAILRHMLERRASLFVIPFIEEGSK